MNYPTTFKEFQKSWQQEQLREEADKKQFYRSLCRKKSSDIYGSATINWDDVIETISVLTLLKIYGAEEDTIKNKRSSIISRKKNKSTKKRSAKT